MEEQQEQKNTKPSRKPVRNTVLYGIIKKIPRIAANEELMRVIDAEIEYCEMRNFHKHKSAAVRAEDEELKDLVLRILADSASPMTIKDLQQESEKLRSYSHQRITAILILLGDKVIRDRCQIPYWINCYDIAPELREYYTSDVDWEEEEE